MKKTAIIASILSLFVVIGVANAQAPTKLTPRQKIAAMRLAKMNKKPVVVATGTVDTGTSATSVSKKCPYSFVDLKLTGFNDTPKENYIYIRDMMTQIETTLGKMDTYPIECGQIRSDMYYKYSSNKTELTNIMNKYLVKRNEFVTANINNIQLEIDAIFLDSVKIYSKRSQCVLDNVNGPALYGDKYIQKECGNSPNDVIEAKKVQISNRRKQFLGQ